MRSDGEMPVVTAVVTTYNSERTVRETVESFLAQSFRDFEVVVVDDGSRDRTRELLQDFGDRIRCVFQQNSGSAASRNAGLRSARGKYIAFLDGDDVALPDRFALQVATLDTNPAAGLAYGNLYLMDANGNNVRLRRGTSRYLSGSVLRELAIKNFVPFSTIMVRRDLLNRIGGFDESIRSSEDWDMLVRLSRICEFLYIDQPLIKYRIMPGSKTADIDAKERAYKLLQEKIFRENDFGSGTPRLRRLSDASIQFGLFGICFRFGKYRRGLRHLLRGVAISPAIVFHLRNEIFSRLSSPFSRRAQGVGRAR